MRRLLNLNHRNIHPVGLYASVIITLLVGMLSACNLVPTQETTPAPTPDLPHVEFLSPPNQATVIEGALLDVDIVAQDETSGIARVEFIVDGNVLQTGETESGNENIYRVTMNWLAEGVGFHSLTAVAYRPTGIAGQETTIVVEVVPDPAGGGSTDSVPGGTGDVGGETEDAD